MRDLCISENEHSKFIFFEGFEDEDFAGFVDFVVAALDAKEIKREQGPYSVIVLLRYEGCELVLTSGSFERCFISLDRKNACLVEKIIDACSEL